MLFVQSRIGMNDVYVGPVHRRRLHALRGRSGRAGGAARARSGWRCRSSACCSGLALASKWVAAYAIGALALLLLVRSALGRVVAILGLIAITGVLGYLAISVPRRPGPRATCRSCVIMVALTLVAVVAAVFHPIAWTDEEMRLAVIAPAAVGALVFFGALALGRLDTDARRRAGGRHAAAGGDRR